MNNKVIDEVYPNVNKAISSVKEKHLARLKKAPELADLRYHLVFVSPMLLTLFWEYTERTKKIAATAKIQPLKKWNREIYTMLGKRKTDATDSFILRLFVQNREEFLDDKGDQPLWLLYLACQEMFANDGIDTYSTNMDLLCNAYIAHLLYKELLEEDSRNNAQLKAEGIPLHQNESGCARHTNELLLQVPLLAFGFQFKEPSAKIKANAKAVTLSLNGHKLIETKIQELSVES